MREFVMDKKMLTMGGVFYPTGHAVIMFPDKADAERTAEALVAEGGFPADAVASLSPATLLRDVAKSEEGSDIPLPSVGTEGATVRSFEALARKGHHGLVVVADSREDTERLMQIARRVEFSLAQKYRTLVIEDLN
ncbi:RNA-binding protein [Xylophilus sp. GOD-11R]|uniref:RNA-binding protein n=1 Tax=Xylophilus sp. GOD-11R TaxID=3089814 RepID=UPI00298BF915|nr:RNA-binding protein [Xylophilus sp. GOD-11R]WPB58242.1 RNA-binding protein [Xylophilus sp. GOD-11R]